MAKTIYMMTYDLKLYTKPDIWDKEFKRYDKESGYFKDIGAKPANIDIDSIECDIIVVKKIMKNMIHSNSGMLLEEDRMKWYLNFEKESKKNPHLLDNDELLFNYLVLKAMLAGMEEDLAKRIYCNYLTKKMNNINVMSVNQILDRLDDLISQKIFWVPDISKEMQNECILIDDIIHSRSTSTEYKFENFEARYLRMCNEGYTRKILRYNKDANNLYSRGLSFEEQREFLLENFDQNTEVIIDTIASNYEYFKGNFASKKSLMDNLRNTLEYAMKFWDE